MRSNGISSKGLLLPWNDLCILGVVEMIMMTSDEIQIICNTFLPLRFS
ncbi:MAG: hypothetical protein ABFD58_12035 [Anaerolineaceae bacterium]